MRMPRDISLVSYIRQLTKEDKLYKFYKSKEWLELRSEVLQDAHYECQECLKKGRYSRADCVHHVNEVKHRPDLALSKHYTDKDGQEKINLLPLCNSCHNDVHERFGERPIKKRFTNEERW